MARVDSIDPAAGWKATGAAGLVLIVASALFMALAASTEDWDSMTYAEARLLDECGKRNISVLASNKLYYVLRVLPNGGTAAAYSVALPHTVKAGLWYSCDTVPEPLRYHTRENETLLWSRDRCVAYSAEGDLDFDYRSTEYRWSDYSRKAQSCVLLVLVCLTACLVTGLVCYLRKHTVTAMLTATLSMYTVIYSVFTVGIMATREEAAPGFTYSMLPEAITSLVDLTRGPSFYYASVSLALTAVNAVTWMSAWKFLTKCKVLK